MECKYITIDDSTKNDGLIGKIKEKFNKFMHDDTHIHMRLNKFMHDGTHIHMRSAIILNLDRLNVI